MEAAFFRARGDPEARRDAHAVNRELKFALIVGFALVLVVTVLISDHLSRARGSKLSSDVPQRPALVSAPPAEDREPALIAALPQAQPEEVTPLAPELQAPSTVAGVTPGQEPVLIAQGSGASGVSGTPVPGDDIRSAIERMGGRIVNGTIYLNPAAASEERPSMPSLPSKTTPVFETIANAPVTPAPISPVAPAPAGGGRDSTLVPPAAAPSERWHTIAAGESAFKIAKQYYGNGNLWRRLVEANPGRIGADGTVRSGVKILIPGVNGTIAPKAVAVKPEAPVVKPAPKGEAKAADSGKARTYVIKKGDSLGLIAQRELGTMHRADEIIALNKSVLSNPDVVPVGVTIKLPAK